MKFSIVAITLLVQGIAAMPWPSSKETASNGGEITFRIQVSDASAQAAVSKPFEGMNTFPVCLKACSNRRNPCPPGWEPFNWGAQCNAECWTCCGEYEVGNL